MKLRSKVVTFSVICILSIFLIYTSVFGENVDIYQSAQIEDEKEDIVNSETYLAITKILSLISRNLNDIDYKLDKARIMDEYERYPLIRLNIDSPYFGITSIVESRLKIKDDISTLDMAKGYNIRSMINSKTIIVKDIEAASIVITTKQITISPTMSKKDAYLCIPKLIEYLNQVKSVSNFLDTELKNTFNEYYTEDKNINLLYLKNEIKNIDLLLKSAREDLVETDIMTLSNTSLEIEKCLDLNERKDSIEEIVNNPLSSEKELNEVLLNSLTLKADVLELCNYIKENYELEKLCDIDVLLKNCIINMDDDINYIKDITSENKDMSDIDGDLGSPIYIKYITPVEKYREELSDLLKSGKYKEEMLDNYTDDEIRSQINKIYGVYLKFLNSYNVALTQVIKTKLLEIRSKNIFDLCSSDDILYVYIDIDNQLLEISNAFDKNSVGSNLEAIKDLKASLDRLITIQNNTFKES